MNECKLGDYKNTEFGRKNRETNPHFLIIHFLSLYHIVSLFFFVLSFLCVLSTFFFIGAFCFCAKWTGASPWTTKYGTCNIQATRSFFFSLYRIFVQCCFFHCLFFLSLCHHVQQIAVKPCSVCPRANSLLQNGRAQAQ